TDQKHFEQHDRIDARTPIILTIQGAAFFRDKRKVDGFIDFSKQVILGNKVFYVDCFGLKFPGWVRPEHIKTFLRNCFIPNSTKKAVDPSLSTASASPLVLQLQIVDLLHILSTERERFRRNSIDARSP